MKGSRILRFFADSPTLPTIQSFDKSSSRFRIPNQQRLQSPQWKTQQPVCLRAAILDWSGTTIDAHVLAPTTAVESTFEKFGVPITNEEARAPMGLRKDLHIAAILKMPSVQARFHKAKGRYPTELDLKSLFAQFVPTQLSILKDPEYSTLVPGVLEGIEDLRTMGIEKIGCTTGFTLDMVAEILPLVRAQGFNPDASVAGNSVIHGTRPEPHMLYMCMDRLGVHLPGEVMKVGDTAKDIGEGLSAGTWTVAVYEYSNSTGIRSKAELASLSPAELKKHQDKAKEELSESGAHYLVPNFSCLKEVAKDINERLKAGESPTDNAIVSNKQRLSL